MILGSIITVLVIIGAFIFIAIDDAKSKKEDKDDKK